MRRLKAHGLGTPWLLVVVFLGCDGPQDKLVGVAVRDSAGVRIVENVTPQWTPETAWRLSSEPLMDIGGGDTDEQQLFRVAGTFRLSDGRIVVANAGTHQVRVHDHTGQFLRRFGGDGEGPGEFRSIFGIYRLPTDSIAVHDTRLQRITVFAPDGSVGRLFTTTSPVGATRVVPAGRLGDGGWIMMFAQRVFDLEPGYRRLSLYLGRYDESGVFSDTVAVLPGVELFVHVTERSRITPTIPFGRGVAVVTRDTGFLAAINDSYEIREYDNDGRLQSLFRRFAKLQAVTTDDLASARAAELARLDNPQFRRRVAEAYDAMSIPTTMPAVGRPASERAPWIVNDPSGGFWVADYKWEAEVTPVWSVFTGDGRLLGTLRLPPRFDLYEVGDAHVLGVWRDPDDVEHVMMYRLVKP